MQWAKGRDHAPYRDLPRLSFSSVIISGIGARPGSLLLGLVLGFASASSFRSSKKVGHSNDVIGGERSAMQMSCLRHWCLERV